MIGLLGILVAMAFGRVVAAQARAKGYNGCLFVLVTLPLCVGGQIVGASAAVAVAGDELKTLVGIVGGLVGGTVGAAIVFVFLAWLPTVRRPIAPPADDQDDAGW